MQPSFKPKFLRHYLDGHAQLSSAVNAFHRDVTVGAFPVAQECLSVKIFRCMAQWRELRTDLTGRIGFVPTMGALHRGHLSLLQASAADNDVTVMSIYVNARSSMTNDFAKYPSTLEDDLAHAEAAGVDVVLLLNTSKCIPISSAIRLLRMNSRISCAALTGPGTSQVCSPS